MRKLLVILGLLPMLAMAEAKDLYWEDMVPKGYVAPDQNISHDGDSMAQINLDAPVVQELDGQQVRIPGFVVPLEGDDEKLTEFLLVPYFGACIHVPPPPPNQIVYVKFEKGTPVESLYDAVWITGTLSTKGWSGDIATVGYSLQGVKVEPYE
ncbi:DUF3299 domain-containing protein [Bowmanella sp. Y26]|uniref:DUF3299 domain-containing protein n=1 Tax=Bowmanella yangjiangensis TaxID=2811230 RepID=UPI001BDBF7C1|nr:DUF3299 domain-containing protein [Bowmanella yangjiangensis]MBT1065961.1 DUF3299 domain-containing protein [Bowmanella yangjiangensis]